ncbi:hypothetical protein BHM03_00055761, partial [Ensete ventricosum]
MGGKKKQEKEGEPRTVPPSNGEAAAWLLETSAAGEPRDGTDENLTRQRLLRRGLLLVAFSSFEMTRKRRKLRRFLFTRMGRRSLGDLSSVRREENEA